MSAHRWFRRRRAGLGWQPATWQGWAITLVAIGAVVAVIVLLRGSAARVPVVIAVFAVYAVVALATGGSRPGVAPPANEPPSESEGDDADVGGAEQREALTKLTRGRSAPSSPGEPALVVERLTKRFGERLAVDDISFSVGVGEVFGFLGPNGAGKTTTVRMLATLIAPTSGRAYIAGVPLDAANGVEIRKRIAVMTENPGLYLRLTVAENLAYFAGLYELAEPQKRIGQALAAVNLASRAEDPCGSLSKGLRQRVALARALLSNPAIVFLDEPTSGLDPVASRDVHELIDGLRERGVTVFLTTHRLDEAERLCERVAILNTRLRTIGRPDELRVLRHADIRGAGGDADSDPDRPDGKERDEEDLGEQLRRVKGDVADDVGGAEPDADQDDEVDGVGEADGGQERRDGFSEQELGGANRRGEDRLERSLVALPDDRICRDHGWEHDRDDQHQEGDDSERCSGLGGGCRRGRLENGDHWRDQEDEWEHGHRPDHEAVAPELVDLLVHDRPDPLEAHRFVSGSSAMSSR